MSGDLGGHFNNASSSRPVRPIQHCGRCSFRYHLTSLWEWGGAPSCWKWNLGSPLQVAASTNSGACQDMNVPLQFFLQRKMAHKASFCIWQQRHSTLENLWHAQWFAEGVLNPRFEHYACWLCRGCSEPQIRTLCLLTLPLIWKVASSLKTVLSPKSSFSRNSNMFTLKTVRSCLSFSVSACTSVSL